MTNDVATGGLEHRTIAERSLIERYHQGTLSADEEERFEAHLIGCTECQEELAVERSFVRGLRTVAAEDAARAVVRGGLLAWLSRRAAAAAVAALAVVALGLALGHLWRENERLEERVAALAAAEAAAGGALDAPLAGVPVVLLGVLRGADDVPTIIPRSGGPYTLAVDVGADPRFTGYALTIVDAAGEVRFERHDLLPDDLEVIQLLVPAGFLPAGEYRLAVRGSLSGGEGLEIGDHRFRVAPPG
jgi:hypothetical protein